MVPLRNKPVACVFIDGENFRYALGDIFSSEEFDKRSYLPRTNWTDFFDCIADRAFNSSRLRTYWYTVNRVVFQPNMENIEEEKLVRLLRKYHKEFWDKRKGDVKGIKKELTEECEKIKNRFESWKRQEDGIATNNEQIEFKKSGLITESY